MTRKEFEDGFVIELTNDYPIVIHGLSLYPVLMKDYFEFEIASSILKIDKDSIPDKEIISKSYLEFLIGLMEQEFSENSIENMRTVSLFAILFRLCCRDEELGFSIVQDGSKKCVKIDDVVLNWKAFDEIRSIILYQNNRKYSDDFAGLDPDLKKDIEEYKKITSRGRKMASIETQEVAVTMATSLKLEDIRQMTIRKFGIVIELMDKKMNYETELTAVAFGSMQSDKTTHYLLDIDSDELDEFFVDYDSFKNKMSGSSEFR